MLYAKVQIVWKVCLTYMQKCKTNKEGLYLGKEVYRNLDTWNRCFLLHMGALQLTNSTTEHNGLDVFSSLSSTICQAI